ncbi:MAG TPA: MXAN_5187 family protein [Myxococcaceae bacterium]|nr:MXAN_5187 family protein [Myxococcaceae bacterium]
MSRIKLLLFALPALALWLADLSLTASSLSEKAVDQAAAYAQRGVDAVSVRLAGRRAELQGLALRLGSSPGAFVTVEALRAGKAELASERMTSVRRSAADAVSSTLRPGLVLGVRTDNGAVFVRGAESPASALNGLEADAVAGAGSDGQTREAFGTSHLFFSFPLLGSDKEARAQGMLIVGGPLLPQGTADQVALETGLSALGLVQAGKLVSSGGPEKARLQDALRETPVGKSAVVVRGPAGSLGFLRLPLFTGGPDPALRVALRRGVPGQPLEALSLVSTEPAMSALADTQRFSLGAMAFLLAGLAALWLWMGQDVPQARTQPQEDTEPGTRRRGLFGLATSPPPVFRAPEASPRLPEPRAARSRTAIDLDEPPARAVEPPPPETAPASDEPALEPPDGLPGPRTPREPPRDDLAALLDAMPPPPEPTPAPVRPPSQRLSPSPATPPRPVPPKPAPAPAPLDYDHQPTTAYPIPNLPDFNLPPAAALGPAANAIPEATRVADVSPDLLASTRSSGSRPQPLPKPVAADEVHFQDVFHEFLAVRERCGESGDGLTFEKFAGKLRKNRDQLVQKYGCRTVRFQVYVKDGRAALKATPVRE